MNSAKVVGGWLMVKGKRRCMTIEKCPHINDAGEECGLRGYLKEETKRFHRVKHYVKVPTIDGTGRVYLMTKEVYHKVPSEWAIKQLDDKQKREEEEMRRLLG